MDKDFKCILVLCNIALAFRSESVPESDDFSKVHNFKVNVKAEDMNPVFIVIVTHEVIQKKHFQMALLLFPLPV